MGKSTTSDSGQTDNGSNAGLGHAPPSHKGGNRASLSQQSESGTSLPKKLSGGHGHSLLRSNSSSGSAGSAVVNTGSPFRAAKERPVHNQSLLEQLSVTSEPTSLNEDTQDGYYNLLHKAQAVASQYERMYWKQNKENLFKTKFFNPANFIVAAGFLQKAKRTSSSSRSSSSVSQAGVHFKKWSPRYCVLTKTMLYLYRADSTGQSGLIMPTGETKIMGELTNCIELADVVDVQAVNHATNMFQNIPLRPGFYLYIKTKQKTMLYRASHLTEARLWASAIIEHCSDLSSLLPFTNVRKIVSGLKNPSMELLVSPLLRHGAHCRDVIAMGRVEKQRDGAIRTGWCSRMFVLTRSALLYFRRYGPNMSLFGEHRGTILLSEIVDVYAETRPVLATEAGNFHAPRTSGHSRRKRGNSLQFSPPSRARKRSASVGSITDSDAGSSDSDLDDFVDEEPAAGTAWDDTLQSEVTPALRTPLSSPVRRNRRHRQQYKPCDKVIYLQSSTRVLVLRVNQPVHVVGKDTPVAPARTDAMTQELVDLIKQAVNACSQRPRFLDVPMVNNPNVGDLDSPLRSFLSDQHNDTVDNQSPILDNSTLAHREDAHDLTDSEAHASTSEESDVDVDHDPAIESRPRRRSRHHESRRRRHSRSSSSHDDDASNRPKPKLSKVDEDNSLPSKEQKTNAVSLPVVEDPLAVAKEFLASYQTLGSILGIWRSSAVQIILLMDFHLLLLWWGANPTLAHIVLLLAHIALLLEVKKLRELREALLRYLGLFQASKQATSVLRQPLMPGSAASSAESLPTVRSEADLVTDAAADNQQASNFSPETEIARHIRAPKVALVHDEFTQVEELGQVRVTSPPTPNAMCCLISRILGSTPSLAVKLTCDAVCAQLLMPGSSLDCKSNLFAKHDRSSGVWSTVPGRLFLVRGPDYGPTKRKIHSLDSLYRCIAVDLFQMPHPEPGIASKFALPQVPPLIQKKCNEHRIAPIIVLNVSLPLSRPIMFGEALSRKCVTCVVFFIIKQSTLKILDEGESHPSFHSVNLWTKWCTQAATDKSMRERLKIIPFINNWDEANMPAGRTLQGWNGKPTLITRSGSVVMDPQNRHIEVCVDVSRFRFLAKQMLYSFFHKCKHIDLQVAFVIQANITNEEELPERVVGCFKLYKVDLLSAPEMERGQWTE